MNYPSLFDETLVTQIRARSVEMDRTGVISADVLEIIYEYGLFKCFLPDFLNGNMKPLPEALRIFEDVSRIDGNLGWIVTIGTKGGYFATYVEPEKLRELYGGRHVVWRGVDLRQVRQSA